MRTAVSGCRKGPEGSQSSPIFPVSGGVCAGYGVVSFAGKSHFPEDKLEERPRGEACFPVLQLIKIFFDKFRPQSENIDCGLFAEKAWSHITDVTPLRLSKNAGRVERASGTGADVSTEKSGEGGRGGEACCPVHQLSKRLF